eukprot:CAMPEP_0179921710 /NCGR_PEP_ID=MMETSP0983-20121128/5216_1 /TAXON_ID=483367 /ORGANISM="non described non described, Strain CCMP 2436" /LENGTH=58 /DNA_ID=CAMNT_0021824939 /DNA_START=549 /DNA_END=721 /DNA_ORIENTATION=+
MKAAASDRAPRKRAVCPPLLKTRILIFSPASGERGRDDRTCALQRRHGARGEHRLRAP